MTRDVNQHSLRARGAAPSRRARLCKRILSLTNGTEPCASETRRSHLAINSLSDEVKGFFNFWFTGVSSYLHPSWSSDGYGHYVTIGPITTYGRPYFSLSEGFEPQFCILTGNVMAEVAGLLNPAVTSSVLAA